MAVKKFDETKKYQQKEDGVYFDDGREIELLHFVYSKPDIADIRGNPSKVLAAIDEFGRTRKYLMNVGEDKAAIVVDAIRKYKPRTMVELGGYVGYSCIIFGEALRASGGERYLSLERNPEFGAVIASLVDLAGLSDVVKVVVGASDASLQRLHASGDLKHIDMLFLDHYKPAYTPDLKLCEELGLIRPGSVLTADNVIEPGNPPYLEYVRSTCEQKRNAEPETTGSSNVAFNERTVDQYLSREGKENSNQLRVGNPNLVYESELIESFEPDGPADGVEITRCVGVEAA